MKIVFGIENQFDIRHSELKIEIGNHKKTRWGWICEAGVFERLPNFLWDNDFYTKNIITGNDFLF